MKHIRLFFLLFLCLALFLTGCEEEPVNQPPAVDTAYSLTVGSTTILINAPAAPILESLGKAASYEESPSCAFEGMDKIYSYPGFDLETYCMGGVDYIAAVQLADDTYTLNQGVTIGSGRDDVLAAYGAPTADNTDSVIYEKNGVRLQFLLRDGRVTNIQLSNMQFANGKT